MKGLFKRQVLRHLCWRGACLRKDKHNRQANKYKSRDAVHDDLFFWRFVEPVGKLATQNGYASKNYESGKDKEHAKITYLPEVCSSLRAAKLRQKSQKK